MKARKTPIPTPTLVRGVGSILVGLSVAFMLSGMGIGLRVALAGTAAVAAIALTLLHPYRREMKYFALANNVDTFPTIGQMVPLMVWWLLLMISPVLAPWPSWGAALAFLIIGGLAWMLYPHVDGTRKLAYA